MAEYTIDKIEYGGNTYKLQDNVSGYTTNTGTLTSAVTSLTTTAGAHTTISNKTGATSIAIPTKTSHLTNDSGFLTSHQDISGKVNKTGDTMSGNLTFSDDGEGIIFTYGTNTSQLGSIGNDGTVPIIGFSKDTVFRRIATPRIDNDAANKKYVDDKVSAISIPTKTSDLTNDSGFITSDNDSKVEQNPSTSNIGQPILFRNNVNSGASSSTEAIRYVDTVKIVPSSGEIQATTFNGYTLAAACAKEVDTSISAGSTSVKLPTSAAVASFVEGKGYITSYTDEKVKVVAGSSSTSYYPILATEAGTATRQYLSTIRFYDSSDYGTQFVLGKNDGTRQGLIQFWSKTSGYYIAISPVNTLTANRGIKLPNKDGTIALTSDLSEYVSMSSDVTDAYVYCSSTAKIGVGGLHSTDNIKYTFRAMATAPSLYDATNSTEIWRGYTTLNKPTASDVGVSAYLNYAIQSTTVNTGASGYTALKLDDNSQTAVKLSAGRYLIFASVQFPAASSGTYGVAVLKNGSALPNSRQKFAFTNTVQRVQTLSYTEFDGNDTFGIGVFQTGASSQAITGYATWVRLRTD